MIAYTARNLLTFRVNIDKDKKRKFCGRHYNPLLCCLWISLLFLVKKFFHCLVWLWNVGRAHSPEMKFSIPVSISVPILSLYFALLFMFSYSTSWSKLCRVHLQPNIVVILSKLSAGSSQNTNTKFVNVAYTKKAVPSFFWVVSSKPWEEILSPLAAVFTSSFSVGTNFP